MCGFIFFLAPPVCVCVCVHGVFQPHVVLSLLPWYVNCLFRFAFQTTAPSCAQHSVHNEDMQVCGGAHAMRHLVGNHSYVEFLYVSVAYSTTIN